LIISRRCFPLFFHLSSSTYLLRAAIDEKSDPSFFFHMMFHFCAGQFLSLFPSLCTSPPPSSRPRKPYLPPAIIHRVAAVYAMQFFFRVFPILRDHADLFLFLLRGCLFASPAWTVSPFLPIPRAPDGSSLFIPLCFPHPRFRHPDPTQPLPPSLRKDSSPVQIHFNLPPFFPRWVPDGGTDSSLP